MLNRPESVSSLSIAGRIVWAVLLCAALPVWGGIPARAQPSAPPAPQEVSPVRLREPRPGRLEAYRSDPGYRYVTAEPPTGWWDRFLAWLGSLLPEGTGASGGRWVTWGIVTTAAALLVWAVVRLLNLSPSGASYGAGPDAATLGMAELEDVEHADFGPLMEAAAARGDYRTAVRYCYLHALQRLAGAGLLTWRPGKTNHEYERELLSGHGSSMAGAFEELTSAFEYAWYGDLRVSAASYETVRASLAGLLANVGGRRP